MRLSRRPGNPLERNRQAIQEATEASARGDCREAAGVSISAFRDAISRAETTGLIARQTAEESYKFYAQRLSEDGIFEA